MARVTKVVTGILDLITEHKDRSGMIIEERAKLQAEIESFSARFC